MTFDIHLASDRLSLKMDEILRKRNYRKDQFIGGSAGVVHKYHLSLHPETRELFQKEWDDVCRILASAQPEDFYGYAEAEIVGDAYVHSFERKPFDATTPLPFQKLHNETCPVGQYKAVDFHISAELRFLEPGLQEVLEHRIGFYHVDIQKSDGRLVRVYTCQPLKGAGSPASCYSALLAYLERAGGIKGKIKMEATYAYLRCPEDAKVPPVIRMMPPFSSEYAKL